MHAGNPRGEFWRLIIAVMGPRNPYYFIYRFLGRDSYCGGTDDPLEQLIILLIFNHIIKGIGGRPSTITLI